MENKTCKKCNKLKGLHEFYKSKQFKCGYKASCIDCLREQSRQYELTHREERVAKHSKWRDENRNAINERNRKRWKNDEEFRNKFLKYKGRYKEWANEYSKTYKKNNRTKCNCREQLRYWVKKGVIQKPEHCEICKKNEYRIQAHHEDYSKPFDVQWLCQLCHLRLHKTYG